MTDSTATDQLIALVYVSAAVKILTDKEILDILRVARAANARLGVTGVLLYDAGNFLQVLEGPDQVVRDLACKIKRDRRHSGYVQLLTKKCSARSFGQWSMGFKRIAEISDEDRTAFTSYLENASEWLQDGVAENTEHSQKRTSAAHVLLKSFKQSCGFVPEPAALSAS